MDLNVTDIILGPVISDKAYKRNKNLNELVLKVHMAANKPQVAAAIRQLFNVEVDKVRMQIRKGKQRKVGKRIVRGKDEKRAIIKLKEGYSIDLMGAQAPVGIPVEKPVEAKK